MSFIRRVARQNQTMLMKTGSYYLIHICVAALVAYAVTGNLWAVSYTHLTPVSYTHLTLPTTPYV